ncbi:hypothetical protein GGF31_003459 [Allomyces arbusculus]|nr:hypothetical protein GGF31_003459 [Allomyces arbusculus]
MKIFMLSGWMGSGKDTAGEYLVTKHNMQRFAFADVMKEMIAVKFNVPLEWMYSQENKAKHLNSVGKTVRQLLIDYGTEERSKDPLVWVKHVIASIAKCTKNVVVTDWRMINEYSEMSRVFGANNVITVRINRWAECPLTTQTENELDDFLFDYTVPNDGDLAKLFENMDLIVETA